METQQEPKRLKMVVIREELVELTRDYHKAIILGQFLYWTERLKDYNKFIEEENERRDYEGQESVELTNGWFYKSSIQLSEEIMTKQSPATIRKYIKQLLDDGLVQERSNPIHKWDKTKQYRIDLIEIADRLEEMGYTLQGFKFIPSIFKNGGSMIRSKKAIPEINTKTKQRTSSKEDVRRLRRPSSSSAKTSSRDMNSVPKPTLDKPSTAKPEQSTKLSPRTREKQKKAIRLLEYWNNLSIVCHRENTKTYLTCISAATKALRKFSADSLMIAMDNYRAVLDNSPFFRHRYTFYDFIFSDRVNTKVFFEQCLSGDILNNEKYMGKKNGFKKVSKKIIDPHPEITKLMADVFGREIYGRPVSLSLQTKDYVYFMDGASIVHCLKKSVDLDTSIREIATDIVRALKDFMKKDGNREFYGGTIFPAYLSSEFFVRDVILQKFVAEMAIFGPVDTKTVEPGRFKKEYLSMN